MVNSAEIATGKTISQESTLNDHSKGVYRNMVTSSNSRVSTDVKDASATNEMKTWEIAGVVGPSLNEGAQCGNI